MNLTIDDSTGKRIAIVSYHNKKKELVEWAYDNREVLADQVVIAAGMTAGVLEGTLGISVEKLASVYAGGDRQLADMIRENKVDVLLFFCDTGKPNKRNAAVKQLIQLATEMNIVTACNVATADVVLTALRGERESRRIAGKGGVGRRRGLPVAGYLKTGVARLLAS